MIRTPFSLSALAFFLAPALIAQVAPALAVTAGDAVAAKAEISSFDETLLSTMRDAGSLGYQGRFDRMAPAVDKTFDLPFMARFLAGAKWNDLSADSQAALVRSFRNYTIGQYANRFNGYDGETLGIVGEPTDQRDDVRIQTQLKPKKDAPVELDYILHHDDNRLKVIDIFLQGTISQLATQRSQFQAVLAKDGAEGLIAMLDKKAADESSSGAPAMPAGTSSGASANTGASAPTSLPDPARESH